MKRILSLALMGAAGLALAACGDTTDEGEQLDAQTANQVAVANVRTNLSGQASAMAFLSDSSLLQLGYAGEPCEPGTPEEYCPEPPAPFDWTEEVDALVAELEQKVFVTANVESEADGVVTYLLQPSIVCTDDVLGTDPDCVDFLTKVPVRLAVSAPAEGDLDIDVLVTASKLHPLTFRLHHDLLAVVVDLDEAAVSLAAIATAMGEPIDLPATLAGEFEVRVAASGPQTATLSALVHRAIRVAEGGVDLRISAATPVVSVTFDGVAEQVTGALSFGPIDLTVPAENLMGGEETCTYDETLDEWVCTAEPSPLSGLFALHLAGLTGATTFDGATEALSFTGLGLGDHTSTVKYAGVQIFGLDVNASAGRTFDLSVTEATDVEGAVDLTVSPSFELALDLDLATVAQEDPSVPAWMHQEDVWFVLDGATHPTLRTFLEVEDPYADQQKGAEVISGRLTLDASSLAAPVVVEAGMCMYQDTTSTDPHPFASVYADTCGL